PRGWRHRHPARHPSAPGHGPYKAYSRPTSIATPFSGRSRHVSCRAGHLSPHPDEPRCTRTVIDLTFGPPHWILASRLTIPLVLIYRARSSQRLIVAPT